MESSQQLNATEQCARALWELVRALAPGTCRFCGHGRADGMRTHALDCEWCTLVQRVAKIEERASVVFWDPVPELQRRGFWAAADSLRTNPPNPESIMHGKPQVRIHPRERHYCTSLTEYECGRCEACRANAAAADPVEPPTDPSAAEPECEAPASTQRGGGEPERAEGSDGGVPGAPERSDR